MIRLIYCVWVGGGCMYVCMYVYLIGSMVFVFSFRLQIPISFDHTFLLLSIIPSMCPSLFLVCYVFIWFIPPGTQKMVPYVSRLALLFRFRC